MPNGHEYSLEELLKMAGSNSTVDDQMVSRMTLAMVADLVQGMEKYQIESSTERNTLKTENKEIITRLDKISDNLAAVNDKVSKNILVEAGVLWGKHPKFGTFLVSAIAVLAYIATLPSVRRLALLVIIRWFNLPDELVDTLVPVITTAPITPTPLP